MDSDAGGAGGRRRGPGRGAVAGGGWPSGRARRAVRALGSLALVLLAAWLSGCGYGRIQQLEEQVVGAQSEIEVQLQRRVELVPGLLETVRGYDVASAEVIGAVADGRARLAAAVQAGDLAAMERADGELSAALNELLSAARVPALDRDAGFSLLRSRLEETEERTFEASRRYNAAVRAYNEYIGGFPQLVTARVIGAERREPLEFSSAHGVAGDDVGG